MLDQVIKPTKDDLADLLNEALSNVDTPAQFVTRFVKNTADILKTNPKLYRAYGPWWWPMKKVMMDEGITDFGQSVEVGPLTHFTLGAPELDCVAAWAYHSDKIDMGNAYSSDHALEMLDGDIYNYQLQDTEMEAVIINQG